MDPDMMQKMMERMKSRAESAAFKKLTAPQRDRLEQIYLQVAGGFSLKEKSVRKQLKLTKDQSRAADKIFKEDQTEATNLMKFGRPNEADQKQLRERSLKRSAQLEALLTDEQKSELAKLRGTAFTLSEDSSTYFELKGPGF